MFEIGWTEYLVIAVVMIVVVGPKDLPGMLRSIGRMVGKMRSMAGDFRKQFDEALKEAELDEVKKTVDQARSFSPSQQIRSALSPMEQAAQDVRAGVDQLMKPKPPVVPAPDAAPAPAEPLKAGTTGLPAATPAPPPAPVAIEPEPNVAATPKKRASKPAASKVAATKPAAPKAVAKPAARPATKKTVKATAS